MFDCGFSRENPLEQYGYLCRRFDAFLDIATHPFVAQTATELTGVPVRLFHDRIIVKHPEALARPHTSVVGWHTDRAYWRTCTSPTMLTAWIPFDDCSVECGTLVLMAGSHRWHGNEWMKTSHEQELDRLEQEVDTGGAAISKVPYIVRRGQVAFHHCNTVHASGPNISTRSRTSWSIHIQDSNNRYSIAFDDTGRRLGHTNDLLCALDNDGLPDYTDEKAFPALTPRTW
jgi:ectoine hydroxylase-related dioxygenase (phytanoyl-CoA dioxygenase family)